MLHELVCVSARVLAYRLSGATVCPLLASSSSCPVESSRQDSQQAPCLRLPEGLDPSAAERVFGFRQATITSLSDSCWRARTRLARALLLPSTAPSPPAGRTAHPAAQRQTGSLAVVGHWSSYQDSTCAPAHPLAPREPGPRLPPALHQ